MRHQAAAMLALASVLRPSGQAAAASTAAAACNGGPAALVFLHGLGDTPAGWADLQQQLPQSKPRLKDISYVFPAAPTISLTINGGAEMPGWVTHLAQAPLALCLLIP